MASTLVDACVGDHAEPTGGASGVAPDTVVGATETMPNEWLRNDATNAETDAGADVPVTTTTNSATHPAAATKTTQIPTASITINAIDTSDTTHDDPQWGSFHYPAHRCRCAIKTDRAG